MMKQILKLFVLVVVMTGLCACHKDEDPGDGPADGVIYDITPTDVRIFIVDQDGNNLLDPETEGNWIGREMIIGSADKVWSAVWNVADLPSITRAYLPMYEGLVWNGIFGERERGDYCLVFGEYRGEESLDMSLTFAAVELNTVFDFDFIHRFSWKNHEPRIENSIIYNGEKIKGNSIELIFPKHP